ncbi:MAG: hypothetical protein HQ472_11025 [Ignavibacteria bacterium]|nr:hypothetical protein [Ignavibacteria bacterium]
MDGDGIKDDFHGKGDDRVSIRYGDPTDPLVQGSVVKIDENGVPNTDDRFIALGKLSGRYCVLRAIWRDDRGTGKYVRYQLIELDSADIVARKDTIGTRILQDIIPELGFSYYSPVIRADTVWWVGTSLLTDGRYLKITPSALQEIVPSDEGSDRGFSHLNEQSIYGQKRSNGERPVVMDAARAMLYFGYGVDHNGIKSPYMQYSVITNTDNLARMSLGFANGAAPSPLGGGCNRATLTPDLDGDGLEDFVVTYLAQFDSTGKSKDVLDLYLTTGRVMTNVFKELSTDSGTTSTLTAIRFDGYWEVKKALKCGGSNSAPIYDIKGGLVGFAKLEKSNTLKIFDPGNLRPGPYWVVVGECAIRIQ